MILTSHQIREAFELLSWTPLMLAERALISLDEAASARDENGIHLLAGLQISGIQQALEAAGIIFLGENGGGAGVRLRKGNLK